MSDIGIKKVIDIIGKQKDGKLSIEFIEIFEDITRNYLVYKKWVEMMIKRNGNYHERKDVIPKLIESLMLIDSIVSKGIENPIIVSNTEQIDGHHRIAIMKALGHDKILCN